MRKFGAEVLRRLFGDPGRRALDETLADCAFEQQRAMTRAERLARAVAGAVAVLRASGAALWAFDSPLREGFMDRVTHDFVYSWRRLRRTPGFTLVAALTLALGVGANTALFSLFNGVLLRPIPVPNLDRLVAVTETDKRRSGPIFPELSAEAYRTIEDSRLTAIDALFVSDPLIGALSGDGQASVVEGELVSGSYFQALGLRPRAGRLLLPIDEHEGGAGAPIVISERLWRRRFSADPAAIGQIVKIAGFPLTIVGVAPDTFLGTWLPSIVTTDVWVPMAAADHVRTVQGSSPTSPHRTFALLRVGVSLAQAESAVATIGRTLLVNEPDLSLTVVPARRAILFEAFEKPGLVLGSAVLALSGLVFLIACANLTNLLLARAAARSGEMAIRIATGASRGRVFRLLLTEVLLLTGLGGAVGMVLAFATTRLMSMLALPELDGVVIHFDPSPDLRVFGYAFVAALVAAIAVGLAPAWQAARTEPLRVLAASGASGGATMRGGRLRTLLVASQITMSIVLLLGAGLYVHSALKAVRFNPGYDLTSGAMASIDVRLHNYDEARGRRLYQRVLDAARQMPGVERAALATGLPGVTNDATVYVLPEGQSLPANATGRFALYQHVSPGFFETLRIPLLRGRDFTDADTASAPGVVIVSAQMAARFWPGQDSLGRRVAVVKDGPLLDVIGVVANTGTGLTGNAAWPYFYVPTEQSYAPGQSIIIRTTSNPTAMLEPLRQAIRSVDPDLAVFDTRTVADSVGLLLTPIRVTAFVLASLGVLGFGIAVLGVYGVMAYFVSRRTPEFGIRRALGATSGQICAVVVRQGARMLVLGVAPGLVLAFIGAGFLRHVLYGIDPHDPITFIVIPLVLVTVGIAASYVPARRAARVDPNVALRHL